MTSSLAQHTLDIVGGNSTVSKTTVSENLTALHNNDNQNDIDIDIATARILNNLLEDTNTPWQIFNCKITEQRATKDAHLPFLYHYDSMVEDLKSLHPLTPQLLKNFKTPMRATEAAKLIGVAEKDIQSPWQVKVIGTLVLYCEPLQVALRVKFTNTAKDADPIYTKDEKDAVTIAVKHWHFYGDVFVVNKHQQPLVVLNEDESDWIALPTAQNYQPLPSAYSLAILAILEKVKDTLPIIHNAIIERVL